MSGTTIASGIVNGDFSDLVADLNAARPLTAGGTGGTSQITGWDGLTAQGTAVPSASTVVLDTVTGPWIDISGTTTITAVTLGNGKIRLARATGAFKLQAGASLVVNGSSSSPSGDYTTTAGKDLLAFTAEGGVTSVTVISPVGGGSTFSDAAFRVQASGDATKQIALSASGITTGTTRTLTAPNASGTLLITTGQTLVSFGPYDNEPPSSNYATLDVRNGHPVLVFPDGVVYTAIFTKVMPRRYSGGNVSVVIDWMSDGTSTNKVCFGAYFERMDIGTTALGSDSFDVEVIDTTGVAGNAVTGVQSQTVINFTAGTNMDGIAAGDTFRLKIARETGQVNDTNTGNIQVTSIEIKET